LKFGFRKPSLNKRIAARTSWKRYVRHSLGFKAPRGWGWLTNPRRAAYNRVYNRTTRASCSLVLAALAFAGAAMLFGVARAIAALT
jgi:hypothetical protein